MPRCRSRRLSALPRTLRHVRYPLGRSCRPRRSRGAIALRPHPPRGRGGGDGALLATFVIYVAGLRSPAIPVDQLPKYWSMSAAALPPGHQPRFSAPAPPRHRMVLGRPSWARAITSTSSALSCCRPLRSPVSWHFADADQKEGLGDAVMALVEAIILIVAASGNSSLLGVYILFV